MKIIITYNHREFVETDRKHLWSILWDKWGLFPSVSDNAADHDLYTNGWTWINRERGVTPGVIVWEKTMNVYYIYGI